MTDEVKKLLRIARKLNKIAKSSGLQEDITNHRHARSTAKKAWKKAQADYYRSLLQPNSAVENPKYLWKVIKTKLNLNSKANDIPTLISEGKSYRLTMIKRIVLIYFS